MNLKPEVLVTTADERTWCPERKNIFLGRWCMRYDRRAYWERLHYRLLPAYGVTREEKDRDYLEIKFIQSELLDVLSKALGKIHNKSKERRYWKLILGHWLRRYVEVGLNRYKSLQIAVIENPGMETFVFENSGGLLATPDSLAFVYTCNDDVWNNRFCGKILAYLQSRGADVKITEIPCPSAGDHLEGNHPPPIPRRWVRRGMQQWNRLVAQSVRFFLYGTYMGRAQEALISLGLGQPPTPWVKPDTFSPDPDTELRRKLQRDIEVHDSLPTLHAFLRNSIFECIPVCFLEGFSCIFDRVKADWPTAPARIFTAGAFDFDEPFKIYTAQKVAEGSQYLVAQHGNNYGTYRWNIPTVEESTADQFLTWGWKDDLSQQVPGFIVGKKQMVWRPRKRGSLLLVEFSVPHRIYSWDVHDHFHRYFEDQKRFVSGLGSAARNSLIIRLHNEYRIRDWFELDRWREFDPMLKIDPFIKPIRNQMEESRIVVFSYDSTGLLETMSSNIPTMAFWQDGLDHVRDRARGHYETLIAAGIIHLTPESIAEKLNDIWDEIPSWWNNPEVRDARVTFCSEFARRATNPRKQLKRFIRRS